MEISPLILIAGGLAAMFFGYFFGLFEGRGQGYKKGRAEVAEEQKKEVIERFASSPPAADPEPQPEDPGLLRVKEDAGRLLVDLDGVQVGAENISPEQRRRLIEVVTRMRPWIDARAAAPASAAVAAPPPPQPAAVAPGSLSPIVAAAAAQGDQPPASLSMVGQIDGILQKNIAGTPLAGRGIKLQDAPGGGVIVIVGLQRFASIGDVSDPEILAALRSAVAQWEKKYTPGG